MTGRDLLMIVDDMEQPWLALHIERGEIAAAAATLKAPERAKAAATLRAVAKLAEGMAVLIDS